MKFSVLMVTYDGEKEERLDKCLASIANQTLKPSETIICLDGFIKESLMQIINKYISRLKIRIIQNKKSSHSENLNIGLENCSYDFIIRSDSDDISLPLRFEEQLHLLSNYGYDVVSSNSIEINNNNKRIKKVPHGLVSKNSFYRFFRNPVNHNACAFRKESIKSFMYPSGRMEDFLLWTKVLNNNMKIYNQNKEQIIADVNNLSSRRVGKDYRKAEIKLFLLNFYQSNLSCKIFSILAFLIRYPLRISFFKFFLNRIYKLIRN